MSVRPRDLLDLADNPLQLEALTGDLGLDRLLPNSDLASPGLVLAGYTARFLPDRMHVLGETEINFLNGLDPDRQREVLQAFFEFPIPVVFVTKGQAIPAAMLELARFIAMEEDKSIFVDAAQAQDKGIFGKFMNIFGQPQKKK